MELALQVKFYFDFHRVTRPWRRTLTNGSDVKYVFPLTNGSDVKNTYFRGVGNSNASTERLQPGCLKWRKFKGKQRVIKRNCNNSCLKQLGVKANSLHISCVDRMVTRLFCTMSTRAMVEPLPNEMLKEKRQRAFQWTLTSKSDQFHISPVSPDI